MGVLQTIRDALALPAEAARSTSRAGVDYESAWASPNHLLPVIGPEIPDRISRAGAMRVPAVARARRLIVGAIARCALEARVNGERASEQPRWMIRSDAIQSPWYRMTWTADDLMFYGWSLWGTERDYDGRVIRADRIDPALWDMDAQGVYVDGKMLDPAEYILIPGPDEGLLSTGADAIRHAKALNRLSQRAAETPSAQIELHQTGGAPLSSEQIKELLSSWASARRGNNGGVAFTNQTIETKEHGKADGQFLIEGRNAAALDIARATGIPAVMIDAAPAGATGTLTYSNAEGRNQELVDYALAPFMAAIAARLSQDDVVPRGWTVAFDLTDLTSLAVSDVEVPDDMLAANGITDDTETSSEELG